MRFGTYLIMIVAALDVRFGWSTPPFIPYGPLGAALFLVGTAFFLWAMNTNTHFEGTVRIQTDRGHRVCDRGPYAHVRHPGYVGFLIALAATPLVLGSWRSFAGAAVSMFALVVRTALEDATLRKELPGYAEFAQRTRYRLVPGIW